MYIMCSLKAYFFSNKSKIINYVCRMIGKGLSAKKSYRRLYKYLRKNYLTHVQWDCLEKKTIQIVKINLFKEEMVEI